jgi:hypothetical protein
VQTLTTHTSSSKLRETSLLHSRIKLLDAPGVFRKSTRSKSFHDNRQFESNICFSRTGLQ